MKITIVSFFLISLSIANAQSLRKFPTGFKFGVASSSYQVEGAWNASDKGENIWDHLTHYRPELVLDRSSGDEALKSYEYYMRDVQAVDDLNVDFYRFSLSWSRILPTGFANKISADGVRYYNALIDALLQRGIKPSVTLYHWDLPQPLQELGGWSNPLMADYYREYARVCFELFGDRVQEWLTFNEPVVICLLGYGQANMAPALNAHGFGEYLCTHNLLRAHAMASNLYNTVFRPTQKGRLGMTVSVTHHEPGDDRDSTLEAVKIINEFEIGWHMNPIFSKEGDYPAEMKEMIAQRSKEQGYPFSRLPEFTEEERKMLIGSCDFLGINHYSSVLTTMGNGAWQFPSFEDDHRISSWQEESWPGSGSSWLKDTPWGFRKLLRYLKERFNNPEIIVFENGFSSSEGNLDDDDRIHYYQGYLNSMLDAIEIDKVNVTAYTAWCLTDNFEWLAGYTEKFGLYSVNMSDPLRILTPKDSAKFYAEVAKTKSVLEF